MTHDILQTDIDLATKLKDDQHPDEDIVLALVRRGITQAKAAQLVDDLRHNRMASIQSAIPAEFALGQRPALRRAAAQTEQSSPKPSPQTASPREQPVRPPSRPRKKSPASWWAAAALVALVIVVVALVLYRRHRDQTNSEPGQPPKPSKQLSLGTPGSGAAAGAGASRPISHTNEGQV